MGQSVSMTALSAGSAGINVKELEDLTYEKSLSSARFMKCIRARHQYGLVVVKVAMRPPPDFKLTQYIKALKFERSLLADVPNALGYQRILETEHCGYLVRQHFHSSVYDRMSTRPFLDDIEKKWLAYQLLCAVRDCHARNIYHGDIKTENMLVTSWNWLYLTDFSSSFKKTYLPEDNPADFSYFFDISGRRTCYLAPERFLSTGDQDDGRGVTWAMDIFSAGCVIAELFVEAPIFSLSQLFRYRKGEFDPTVNHLNKIEDKDIRELVTHMIQVEPESRYSAEEYLNFWRRKAFPEYFYSFLHQYMALITDPSSGRTPVEPEMTNFGEADERIDRIFYDFDKISYFLGYETNAQLSNLRGDYTDEMFPVQIDIPSNRHAASELRSSTDDGTLIFLTLVVSSIRNSARAASRIRACDLLLAFGERVTDEAKLDRILPFLVGLINDKSDAVKIAALKTTTQLLSLIEVVSPVNANVFTEYIRPKLHNMIESSPTAAKAVVRATYAACLAPLAHTSLRILDIIQALRADGNIPSIDPEAEDDGSTSVAYKQLYDVAKADLVLHFEAHTKALLTDSDSSVRRAFLQSVSSLCVFFGPSKANDVVLSHLNTYLNDKDWMLKCAFFQTIVGVATYVGSTSLEEYILPLMLQSLSDPEEFVVERVLRSFATMGELGLLQRSKSWEMLDIVSRFTMHPNIWIQEASVHFITSITGHLSIVDNRCIVLPLIQVYLKYPIYDFAETNILDVLKRPLPRTIFEMAMTWSQKAERGLFWKFTPDQRTFSFRGPEYSAPLISSKALDAYTMKKLPKNSEDEQWLSKLRNLGMASEDEVKLIALREYISRTGARKPRNMDEKAEISFGNIVSLTELNVVPQIIFFEHRSPISRNDSRKTTDQHQRPRTRRVHTITDALLDASTTVEDPESLKRSPSADPSKALDIPKVRRISSHDASPASSSPASRLVPSSSHDGNQNYPSGRVQTNSSRNGDNASDGTLTPIGSLKDGKMVLRHRSSAMALLNRRDIQKSLPETRTDATNAIGEMNNRTQSNKSPKVEDDTQRGAVVELETQAGHDYKGNDPNVIKLLDSLATEKYPVDQYDFGPLVTPVSRRPKKLDGKQTDAPWQPQGVHIATFGEHRAGINRILPSPDHIFFITASDDGSVKVWDTGRLEKNLNHRSRQTYRHAEGAQVKCITFVENTHAFVSCANDGSIHINKVDCAQARDDIRYGRLQLKRSYKLPSEEYAIWCEHFRMDGKSTLLVATNESRILAIDLRTMSVMFELSTPLNYGPPTCFVVDRKRTWLLVGTSRGILCLFDLRFRLAVKSWGLSGGTPIHRMALHPNTKLRGKLVCIVGGTSHADVTVWDVVSLSCREVYRACTKSEENGSQTSLKDIAKIYQQVPISKSALLANAASIPIEGATRALAIGSGSAPDERDSRYSYLITGGTDRRVRFWDLTHIEDSVTISGLPTNEEQPLFVTSNPSPGLTYNVEKLRKEHRDGKDGMKKKVSRAVEIQREQKALLRNHLDDITDVTVMDGASSMILSVDRRGCVYVFR